MTAETVVFKQYYVKSVTLLNGMMTESYTCSYIYHYDLRLKHSHSHIVYHTSQCHVFKIVMRPCNVLVIHFSHGSLQCV